MSEIKKQWYVIRAVGGKEAKVKEYIEAEVRHNHLEDYISQVLIPTEKVYTIRNGKKISKEKVSYPGYVLVEAAFVGQIPILLRNTPNVLGFLGDTKEESRKMIATPLRPQEVARILGRVDEMSVMEEENEIPFFVGETVKVTDGPFSSFQGTIEAVAKVVPPILRPRLVPRWVPRESISWTSASNSTPVRRTRRERFFRSSLLFTAISRSTLL